ncbi:MAG: hypothetical protein WBA68_03055 [Alteraurantiacibacter sp.]
MTTIQKVAFGLALVAIALGAYLVFVQDNAVGIVAMAIGASCAALSAAIGGLNKKGKNDAG